MKKIVKLSSIALLSTILMGSVGLTLSYSVDAATTSNVESKQENRENVSNTIDSYVSVKNNQYVLNDAVKNVVSKEDYKTAKALINNANKVVNETNSTINVYTKSFTNDFELTNNTSVESSSSFREKNLLSGRKRKKYHFGVNKVVLGGWNYVKIYLNRSQAKAISQGAISFASTGLGGAIGSLTGNPLAGGAAGAAVGAYLGSLAADSIKGGVWVDYNFFSKHITRFGWQ